MKKSRWGWIKISTIDLSDEDLIVATQIAYYDFDYKKFASGGNQRRLGELLRMDDTTEKKIKRKEERAYKKGGELEKIRALFASSLYESIASDSSAYSQWKIPMIQDDNENTGFYACLIEVNPDVCILSFRGSESNRISQIEKDWIHADFKLLNTVLTKQQAAAGAFVEEVYERYDYSCYYVTGHSLGGNLAIHGFLNAPSYLQNRCKLCVSFDGPGFSMEYLEAYQEVIKEQGNLVLHFQWSVIGALLFPLPGVYYESIRTDDRVYGKKDMGSLLQKHDVCFLIYDEDGSVVSGEMDEFSKKIGFLSRGVDRLL